MYYELVNQSKLAVSEKFPLNVLIDAISEGFTTSNEPEGAPDIPHYDSMSGIKLGHLFATELSRFFTEEKGLQKQSF